jgi:hypothetical protein
VKEKILPFRRFRYAKPSILIMNEAYPILSNKGNVFRHSSICGIDSINDDSYKFKNLSIAASPDKPEKFEIML